MRLLRRSASRNDRGLTLIGSAPNHKLSYFQGHCEPDGSHAVALAKA
jgi:hypothetical protein